MLRSGGLACCLLLLTLRSVKQDQEKCAEEFERRDSRPSTPLFLNPYHLARLGVGIWDPLSRTCVTLRSFHLQQYCVRQAPLSIIRQQSPARQDVQFEADIFTLQIGRQCQRIESSNLLWRPAANRQLRPPGAHVEC